MTTIKLLLEELEEYEEDLEGSCSCHIHPPCSYCVGNGNYEECVTRIKDFVYGNKYLTYMVNVDKGDGVSFAKFIGDWEPIGPTLLHNMQEKGEIEMKDMVIYLTEDLYNIVGG